MADFAAYCAGGQHLARHIVKTRNMKKFQPTLDLKKIRVYPLAERESEAFIEKILIDPESPPPILPRHLLKPVKECVRQIAAAHRRHASVMLIYGAHLIKNGGSRIMNS